MSNDCCLNWVLSLLILAPGGKALPLASVVYTNGWVKSGNLRIGSEHDANFNLSNAS